METLGGEFREAGSLMRNRIILVVTLILLGVGSKGSPVAGFERHSPEAARAEATTAAYGIALQPDNKILAAGTALNQFALARYNPDGSLDLSFDEDGKVLTSFGANAAGAVRPLYARA